MKQEGTYGKTSSPTDLAYQKPDVVKVRQIVRDYGLDAACERWSWIPRGTLQHMSAWGGQKIRAITGEISAKRRTITPEQEEEIIAAAEAAGMVSDVGIPWGVSDALVRTLFRERGRDFPKKTYERRASEQAERRQARRAETMSVPPVSIRGPAPKTPSQKPTTETKSKAKWGKERKVPPDEVIRSDREAGMTTSAMATRYGVTSPCVYSHLKRLNLLRGIQVAEKSILPAPIADKATSGIENADRNESVPSARTKDVVPVVKEREARDPRPAVIDTDARSAEEADLPFMILAARICVGAKCPPATAVGIVSAWRAMG